MFFDVLQWLVGGVSVGGGVGGLGCCWLWLVGLGLCGGWWLCWGCWGCFLWLLFFLVFFLFFLQCHNFFFFSCFLGALHFPFVLAISLGLPGRVFLSLKERGAPTAAA
ncbi:hypothetical protein RA269_27730, partial [Pseudomonas syringae pv. tagetis]